MPSSPDPPPAFYEIDGVELLEHWSGTTGFEDSRDFTLLAGAQGTVVYVYGQGEKLCVEFVEPDGTTLALADLQASQVKLAWRNGEIAGDTI